jgi:hypothetical protein
MPRAINFVARKQYRSGHRGHLRGLGATTTTTSTPEGLQLAQQYIAAAVAQVQANVQSGKGGGALLNSGVYGGILNSTTTSINQLVSLGQLAQPDANAAIAQLQTQMSLANNTAYQSALQTQQTQAQAVSAAAATAAAATADTITLPIIGTVTYTEAAIGAAVVLGAAWLLFSGGGSKRR